MTGTVTSYNRRRGFGFIESNGEMCFFHNKEIEPGYVPQKGDTVSFMECCHNALGVKKCQESV